MRLYSLAAVLTAGLSAAAMSASAPAGSGAGTAGSRHAAPDARAADTLRVGERAPDFTIPSTVSVPDGSGSVHLGALTSSGRSVVVAFFPKAFTGG